MKKVFIFLAVAVIMGCKCIGQLPTQVLDVGEFCEVPLPDYRDSVTVSDNCMVKSILQTPEPGTILDATNPIVNVIIAAMDNNNNMSTINFDVIMYDDTPPIITPDPSMLTYTWDERFGLLDAFQASVHEFIPDSIWESHYLAMFSSAEGRHAGGWYPDSLPMVQLTQDNINTLGWVTTSLRFDPTLAVSLPFVVDCGSPTDDWFTMVDGGRVGPKDIPELDPVYRTERYGNFEYAIPVGVGTFEVQLHFAEIFWDESGKRIFNVELEREMVLVDYDIVAEVGENVSVIHSYVATVTDGWMNIVFTASVDSPDPYAKISGIVITPIEGEIISSIN